MFTLSQTDMEQIDRDSLRILGEIGIRVDDEALRDLALKNGAKPGRANDWILLPPEMVQSSVKQAPEKAPYADCRGEVSELGPGTGSTFWTGAALNYVSGEDSHPMTMADLASFARVGDSLEGVFAITGTSVAEVSPQVRDVVGLRIMASNTQKHLRPLLFNADNVRPMIDMAQVIAGDKPLEACPLLSFGYSCLSPLHWARITTDMWTHSSGHKVPLMINGEPIAGATSPVTLAGSLSLSNAEILAGVVLTQLLEPGRPVVHNLGFAHVTDMKTGACLSASAECALLAYAGAKMAEYYRLPSGSWMCTESFVDDQQASLEKMFTGFAHVLGGVNVIWGMGHLESQKGVSAVQLVIDNELALALQRFWKGVTVNEESLALDVIREVVETGGDFLSHEHTFNHFKEELSESTLVARTTRENWVSSGSTDLAARAAETVNTILSGEAENPLSDDQQKEIAGIEAQVLKNLG